MTIYKSQQVNLDPKPYAHYYDRTDRSKFGNDLPGGLRTYAPRPEFEPTRDPEPWVAHDPDGAPTRWATREAALAAAWVWGIEWAPRREQFDTPVNRVLVAFRDDVTHNPYTAGFKTQVEVWLIGMDFGLGQRDGATPDEIDHARRVLTRLANWKE